MKSQSPKIGKDNEVTLFYPEKRIIPLQDMTTELAYKLDAIPKDRNSHFTTRYLNVLQKDNLDDSALWSVPDRIFAVLQYGIQQNKDLVARFKYGKPCQYCGKHHVFTFDYASLFSNYKAAPVSWPVEHWDGKKIHLKPITGKYETLIEFQKSQKWDERLNDHEKGTIEYENFVSELQEHNANIFYEIQYLRVAAHTGIEVEELKGISREKFQSLLIIVQKHVKTLNYGIQFWKNEDDHIKNPGEIEHFHTCPEPDVEYMKKTDPELLERYKKGGLEAIHITVPFLAQYCT